MKVIIYVEGPSDKAAMQALLKPLIDIKQKDGIAIEFFDSPEGDKKESVIRKVPIKAVNIIRNDPNAVVIALPDLYPPNKGFPHTTADELLDGISQNFVRALNSKGA